MVEQESLRRGLSVALGVVLVASLIGLVVFVIAPIPANSAYTEFYILGPGGNASDYPENLSVGESGTVIVGITNHEHEEETYELVVETDRRTLETREVTLAAGETWEDEVSFSFDSPGERRVQFLLYLDGEEPYRRGGVQVVVSESQ